MISTSAVREADPTIRFSRPALAYFGWLAGFNLFYATIGGVIHPDDPWHVLDEWVGLPTFLLGIVLLVDLLRKPR